MINPRLTFPIIIFLFIFIQSIHAQDNSVFTDTVKLSLKPKQNCDTNSYNIFPKKYSNKKIALVLSGGGARGIAQLGVIRELEKNDVGIDLIVGTSIGSLIGGFYASGYTTGEIENMLITFDWSRALSLTNKYQRTSLFLEQKKIQDRSLLTIPLDGIKPILLPSSLSNGYYLTEKINSLILNSRYHPKTGFEDLKIPFAAVATDFDNGKKVVLTKGNLSESIKASLTFPLLYTPIKIDGKNLVDGGLTSNIPNDVAKNLGADYTIVVNSTSPLKSNKELDDPLNTADQIISITMEQLNKLQLKDANIVITPVINNYSATDFSKISYLIRKGEEIISKDIEVIKSDLDSIEISESAYFNNFITRPVVRVIADDNFAGYKDTILSLTDKNFERYTSIEKNLKMIYKSGYFKDAYAVISRDDNSAYITYHLISNPVLEGINVSNPVSFLDTAISNFRKRYSGEVINSRVCSNLYDSLLGVLRANSYSFIEINKFHFDYFSNTLDIEFSKGTINSIDISGNKSTNADVILREITITPESPVKRQQLSESIRNVMSTNLFGQVSFDFDYKKNKKKTDLKVNLIEKNTKALRFSMKIDNEKNFQLLVDLRDENLFGSAIETGLLAAGGLRNRIYLFDIKTNQFLNLPLTLNYNLYYTFNDINRYEQIIDTTENEYEVNKTGEYRDIKYGMSLLFGTQLERLGTIYTQAYFENQRIKNKYGSEDLPTELRVIKLKFGGVFDNQDILPFPTKGSLINFYYETAKNTLEGELSYTKLYISYDQYFSIAKSQIIRPRFIFGFADKTTPLTEQFSLGGERSFFGMYEDELRGRQILETSLEYRYLFPYKIFFDTYFSIRYDLGNVWQVTEDIRFKDLRHGIGLTSSFDTPIGEASFSVGRSFLIKKGLTKDSFVFGPFDFYFSIGYDIF